MNDWQYKSSLTTKQLEILSFHGNWTTCHAHTQSLNSMYVIVCALIIKFSRLPHGTHVDTVLLLKTWSICVRIHWWILTQLVWTTYVTYSEHPTWLFSLRSLHLFGDGFSNIVLSLFYFTTESGEGRQTLIFISIEKPLWQKRRECITMLKGRVYSIPSAGAEVGIERHRWDGVNFEVGLRTNTSIWDRATLISTVPATSLVYNDCIWRLGFSGCSVFCLFKYKTGKEKKSAFKHPPPQLFEMFPVKKTTEQVCKSTQAAQISRMSQRYKISLDYQFCLA